MYDPLSRTGYIETRLRNSRRNLEAHKKKYVLKKRRPELSLADPSRPRYSPVPSETQSSEQTQRWVELMKRTRPLTKNLPAIHSAMDQTFYARRRWISHARPSIRTVLAEYPRFLDVPSTVSPVLMEKRCSLEKVYMDDCKCVVIRVVQIDLEFERMFPGKGHSLLAQWSSFVLPRIYQIAEREKHPEISSLLQQAGTQQGGMRSRSTCSIYLRFKCHKLKIKIPFRKSDK